MVEKAAEDYAKIIKSIHLEREINPICINIEDMLARLDEFESLLSSVRAENSSIVESHVSGIIEFSDHFLALQERIDKLEQFVDMVHTNVNEVEKSLDIAELELNITGYSLRGFLFKPLFSKVKATAMGAGAVEHSDHTNLKDGEFQPVPVFQTNLYFGGSQLSFGEEALEANDSKVSYP